MLGATVLPAATVTVVPASEPLGPVAYEIRIDDPVQQSGTVEATAPVAATGTYPIQVAATGVVVFRNFNSFDVAVDAGTLVAVGAEAGDQAFETTEDVVVPAGQLTAEGTILAGEEAAGIVAAAIGPAANVAADAINTILSQNTAARLRGFGNNRERLVLNPEATAGGVDDTGTEITQQDVDDAHSPASWARWTLPSPMRSMRPVTWSTPIPPSRPNRSSRVSTVWWGPATWRRPRSAARSPTTASPSTSPRSSRSPPNGCSATPRSCRPGTSCCRRRPRSTIGEARQDGDALIVAVTVTGASTPVIDRDEVVDRVRGRSVDEAEAALAGLGTPTVDLWPGWVSSVPGIDWRIEVRIAGEDVATPVPSSSASAAP